MSSSLYGLHRWRFALCWDTIAILKRRMFRKFSLKTFFFEILSYARYPIYTLYPNVFRYISYKMVRLATICRMKTQLHEKQSSGFNHNYLALTPNRIPECLLKNVFGFTSMRRYLAFTHSHPENITPTTFLPSRYSDTLKSMISPNRRFASLVSCCAICKETSDSRLQHTRSFTTVSDLDNFQNSLSTTKVFVKLAY